MLFRTPRASGSVRTCTRAIATSTSCSASSSSAPVPRHNKRTARSHPSKTLSSLISLYHLSPTFSPLDPALLSPHVSNAFIKDSSLSAITPKKEVTLFRAKKTITSEAMRLDEPGKTLQDIDMRLSLTSSDDLTGMQQSFQDSFRSAWATGSEPPLARRVRRLIDVLHGTEAGGQAGLHTVIENGGDVVEFEQVRKEEQRAKVARDHQLDLEEAAFEKEFGN